MPNGETIEVEDEEAEDEGNEGWRAEKIENDGGPVQDCSALKIYLNEIGRVGLLTRQKEAELFREIKKGSKRARTHMIEANLRLVVKIANEFEGFGLPLLDLINEGNIGLMKAVERFDPSKGTKISTYASWWIKQTIRRALSNQSKTIRIPVHMIDKIWRMNRTARKLESELGRPPADDELADELSIPSSTIGKYRQISAPTASLNQPIGGDENPDSGQLMDIIPDVDAENSSDELAKKNLYAALREIIAELQPREAMIMKLRYGLNGKDPLTLEEVGLVFKVTRERIRQIQELALIKVRKQLKKRDEISIAKEMLDV